jgi:uncharacterized protein YndB with AHSA1/START domain
VASFTLKKTIAAPAEIVFDLFTDHRGYTKLTPPGVRVKLEREGDPAPDGIGAIRAIHALGPPLREEVVEFVRPTRFVYKIISGVPVKDHSGTVELTQVADKTEAKYHLDFTPKVPGVGVVLRIAVTQLFDAIAKESEKRAKADPRAA